MFAALGAFAARRRRLVLLLALAFLLVGGAWGAGAPGSLSGGGGFDDPGSESSHADTLLAGQLGRQVTDVVAVYHSDTATVDDPAFAQAVQTAAAHVPRTSVTRLETFWSTGSTNFVSADRHSTYVGVQLASADDQTRVAQFKAIQGSFAAPGLTVRFGGMTPMTQQVNQQVGQDIARAELFSVPVLLVLLVVIFGSAVAAGLPLVIGILAAVGSLAVVRGVTLVTDLSTFAINVVSILGLGLAIDYSLLLVNRFREELAAGRSVDDAVRRTVATAGRTVAFSGLTVAISLLGLVVFPSKFLQSMGWAGASTVLFAALSSITVLPALLRVLGPRVNALRVRRLRPIGDVRRGRWHRVAHGVMRRPIAATVGIVIVLLLLGSPFFGVNWARPGDWVLPVDADARAVTQIMATQFPADPAKIVTGVVEFPGVADSGQATDFARRLSTVPGVTSSAVTGAAGDLVRISLGYKVDPMSVAASDMIHGLRAVSPPAGAQVSFTGMPASRVDIVQMIGSRLPWMALFVALVSFVVMFLAFGSVVLPLKSLVLNLLSLSASFGAIKLIFQDGWLSGVLDFVPVGAVDVDFPVLVIAIAFGLSMDYEVFLLSRVREEWVRGGDTTESVAIGLQRTAHVITSAALLLVVVVGGFLVSGITFMKMLGVGLIIAVIVDATVVRGLLVPATMKLLGKWAWWSPAPLARWWDRHGLRDVDEDVSAPVRELVGSTGAPPPAR